ncbi:MAG: hypothetical protein IT381_02410 [Deltaproteobacteria bacterium]|nr:hypothetical protein [Deltaproteobacteria bacterium]
MGIKIDPCDDDDRQRRTRRWAGYNQYLQQLEQEQAQQLQQVALSRQIQAQPTPTEPAASDAVQRAPKSKDWMTGIRRVGAAQEGTEARSTRGNDPRPVTEKAQQMAASVHEELTDVFGDEAETIERADAEILSFVHKKTPRSVAGKEEALRVDGLLGERAEIMQRAELRVAGDAERSGQLAPYRQWSANLVGRAETKVRYLLGET